MKKIALILSLLATAAPARAGIFWDIQQYTSSATARIVGVMKWYASSFGGAPTITADGATGTLTATTLNGSLASSNLTGPVPPALVSLSTMTTALAAETSRATGAETALQSRASALELAQSTSSAVQYALGVSTYAAPGTGSCTLPNVVTALNAHGAPTCSQPSNVTGNAANVTGIVAVANGGTGAANAVAAQVNLNVPSTTGSGAGGTWPVNINGNAVSASTVPWSGLQAFPAVCSLPNVVTGVGVALTCTQPSNVTGNAATVTTNANLTGPVTSVGNATSVPGPIPQSAVNLSTVPATGTCTLPNVVTALNAGAAPTCSQPSNVTGNAATATNVAAAGVQAGTLGATVIASSVAATGVSAGAYGAASQTLSATVASDGRLSALSAQAIAVTESQVTNLVTDLAGKQATGNYVTALTGDVTATGPGSVAAAVNTVGGTSAAMVAQGVGISTSATSANTANMAVKRDASGNFSAGTVTAALSGNATTASALAAAPTACSLPNLALGVGANGNASCAQPSNVTGNAATATALAAAGSSASSGFLARGVDASGNALPAFVETNSAGVSGSTNPWSAGAAYTGLAGKQASGSYSGVGACTLPNVVTGVNTSAGPTCGQPSNVSGTAAALAAAGSAAASGSVCRGVDASGNCLPASVDATTNGIAASTSPWSSGAANTSLAAKANLSGATFTGASGITNANFTATGASGNIVSAASMTASAFFGDGSHLSGIGAGTLAGGVNNYSMKWTGATSAGLGAFYETTSSVTAVSTFTISAMIQMSTTSADMSGITATATGGYPCVSTVTFTTNGEAIEVWFAGSAYNSALNARMWLSYLVDGALKNNWANTAIAQVQAVSTGSGYGRNMSFKNYVTGLAAGTHSACIMALMDSGTMNFYTGSQFGVVRQVWSQ